MTDNDHPSLRDTIRDVVAEWEAHDDYPHVCADQILDLAQMQQLKAFALGAAQHAASVGMEKSMDKYLEAMGLDEITIEWVLS